MHLYFLIEIVPRNTFLYSSIFPKLTTAPTVPQATNDCPPNGTKSNHLHINFKGKFNLPYEFFISTNCIEREQIITMTYQPSESHVPACISVYGYKSAGKRHGEVPPVN